MKLTKEIKKLIDSIPLERLKADLDYAPSGEDMFQGESGQYWRKRIQQLENQMEKKENGFNGKK